MSDFIDVEVFEEVSLVEIEATEDIALYEIEISETGSNGVGVPAGGTTGQVLSKTSDTDFDTEWKTNTSAPVISVNGEVGAVVLDKTDVGLGNVDNTSDNNKPVSSAVSTALSDKVDKISGKGLSTEDYTTTEKSKLSGIASGAEVNVNADWSASTGDAFIQNKPTTFTPTVHTQEAHGDLGYIDLNTAATAPAFKEGRTFWDSVNHCPSVYTAPDITMQVGQEVFIRVCNKTTSPIINGQVVYINSADAVSGFPTVQLARANEYTTSRIIGISTQVIPVGECGMITCIGEVNELDTSLYVSGDIVYLSPTVAGEMTKTRPSASNFVVMVGIVSNVSATVGRIFVMPKAEDYATETHEATGWSQYNKATISFDNASRTLNVMAIGTEFVVYQAGIKYTKATDSIQIPNTEGLYVVYYVNGVLTYALSPSNGAVDGIIRDYPTVAYIYWDVTNQREIYLAPELHSIEMPSTVHAYLHFVLRARWMTGITPNTVSADESGNLATSAQFGIDAGGCVDEDLYFPTPLIASTTGLPIFYIAGTTASPTLRMRENTGFSVTTAGTGRLAFNSLVGGNWVLSEVANGDFALCHVFFINDNTPSKRVIAMVGQAQYTTTANAREGAAGEIASLLVAGLVPSEMKAIATFVFQTSNTYTNAVKSRVISFSDTEDYVDFRLIAIGGGSGGGSVGIPEAPIDGISYGRKDGGWSAVDVTSAVWGNLTGSISSQLDLTGELNNKENAFSKNTAFNKNFGTGATDVTVGNDTRLSNARTPTSHDNTAHSTAYATETSVAANGKLISQMGSTGLISGCALTINADTSKYDMASGVGVIIDAYTDPANPTRTAVVIPARTGLTPGYLATDATSYVFANASGSLVYNNYGSTPEDRRDLISIGWIDHTDNATIGDAHVQPFDTTAIASQLNDFFLAFGPFNITGNAYGATGGLQILRSAGDTFDSNANYDINRKAPHILTTNLEDPCDVYYYYRNGAGDWVNDTPVATVITPSLYDNGSGTLAAVPSNQWTIQLLAYYAQTGSNDIQYGQVVYASKEAAKSALQDAVEINPYNNYDTFRGWLVVKQGATDLTDMAQAEFVAAGKLGLFDVASGGGTGGEVNTASSLGTGTSLYAQKIGVDLQFNSLSVSGALGIAAVSNVITVSHTDNASTRHITDTLLTKLNGIAEGAQVNTVASVNGATGAVVIPVVDIRTFVLHRGENATVGTSKTNKLIVMRACTITRCSIASVVAPVGASLICDVNRNGASIWGVTQANRISLADGGTYATQTVFDTTGLIAGDILTIDIDQIGSSVAGQDITVEMEVVYV